MNTDTGPDDNDNELTWPLEAKESLLVRGETVHFVYSLCPAV